MKRIQAPAEKKATLILGDDQVAVHSYQEQFQRQGYFEEANQVLARPKQKRNQAYVALKANA